MADRCHDCYNRQQAFIGHGKRFKVLRERQGGTTPLEFKFPISNVQVRYSAILIFKASSAKRQSSLAATPGRLPDLDIGLSLLDIGYSVFLVFLHRINRIFPDPLPGTKRLDSTKAGCAWLSSNISASSSSPSGKSSPRDWQMYVQTPPCPDKSRHGLFSPAV